MSTAHGVTWHEASSELRVDPDGLLAARHAVDAGLDSARRLLVDRGVTVPDLDGKLLRPLVAYALLGPTARADDGFWLGALAIQMVHEASLLHDDIIDGASRRRGEPTAASSRGIGAALVLGDLYLTGAYRAASQAGKPTFLQTFIDAVDRTVLGEAEQGRSAGRRVSTADYDRIVRGKAGALFGAAAVLAAHADDAHRDGALGDRIDLGERLGATYQRIDDLLDYCTACDTGKPPLQDYRQRKWTWVLDLVDGVEGFDREPTEVASRLFEPDADGRIPARAALATLEVERTALLERVERLAPGDRVVGAIVDAWLARAVDAVELQAEHGSDGPLVMRSPRRSSPPSAVTGTPEEEVRVQALALGGPERWPEYFGRHAKTFRLASRLFPADAAGVIAGVYAFCRFTDDLVDDPIDRAGPERVRQRLAAWRMLTEEAWAGHTTGIPVLDEVIGGAAASGVSAHYPMALLDGVEMDLDRSSYQRWDDLEQYTFCVAGAVGGWLTQGFGFRDPTILRCAHSLGHAMQLTNIARDVGEDWERGRVYLPLELLAAHDLDPVDLGMLPGTGDRMPGAWVRVVEALLSRADAHYARAWPGIRALPGWYRRPVAAAATAYRGIHDEIRTNGYDNLTRRAHTSGARKLWLALTGVTRALRASDRPTHPEETSG
ncbi:MAG: squalene/phytoene synthase family protein [Gemmatimonadota bacterium]